MSLIFLFWLSLSTPNAFADTSQKLVACNAGIKHSAINESSGGFDNIQFKYEDLSVPVNQPFRYQGNFIRADQSANWVTAFDNSWNYQIDSSNYLFSTETFGTQYYLEFCYVNTSDASAAGYYFLNMQLTYADLSTKASYSDASHLVGQLYLSCQLGDSTSTIDDTFTPGYTWTSSEFAVTPSQIQFQTPVNQASTLFPQKCLARVYFSEKSTDQRPNLVNPKSIQVDLTITQNGS